MITDSGLLCLRSLARIQRSAVRMATDHADTNWSFPTDTIEFRQLPKHAPCVISSERSESRDLGIGSTIEISPLRSLRLASVEMTSTSSSPTSTPSTQAPTGSRRSSDAQGPLGIRPSGPSHLRCRKTFCVIARSNRKIWDCRAPLGLAMTNFSITSHARTPRTRVPISLPAAPSAPNEFSCRA